MTNPMIAVYQTLSEVVHPIWGLAAQIEEAAEECE